MTPRVVLDTCVLVAGLRSHRGASHRLLRQVGIGYFEHVVSVPLVIEYEAALRRPETVVRLAHGAVDDVLDFLCLTGVRQDIHFAWRPALPDPGDDFVLEVAVNGQCDAIVTFNLRDFVGAGRFGVAVLTPQQFLTRLEGDR